VVFDGRVGLVRRAPQAVMVQILEGDAIETDEVSVRCSGPLSLSAEKGRVTGTGEGPSRSCRFRLATRPPGTPRLAMDGRQTQVEVSADGWVSFRLSEGRHEFELIWDETGKPE